MHYIFTNDEDYMTTKTDLKFKQKGSVNPKDVLVRELRTRVDFYYRILIRNLRDSIPKVIYIKDLIKIVYRILFGQAIIR